MLNTIWLFVGAVMLAENVGVIKAQAAASGMEQNIERYSSVDQVINLDDHEVTAIAAKASEACSDHLAERPYRKGNVICLRGAIDKKYRDMFLSLRPARGDTVVASGVGGDIAAAMDIGDVLYAKRMKVVVDRPCGSSCAYFLALGARSLAFVDEGLLGFHGGPVPEQKIRDIPNTSQQDKAIISRDNRRFEQFFQRRGIDISITFTPPPAQDGEERDWTTSMWVRLPSELPGFGVKTVVHCSAKHC